MTSCQRLQNSISHHIIGGLLRQKCHHGKMLGTISFHILWTSRSSFSPCPYGIVVVVFHFDSGGRKAQSKSKIPASTSSSSTSTTTESAPKNPATRPAGPPPPVVLPSSPPLWHAQQYNNGNDVCVYRYHAYRQEVYDCMQPCAHVYVEAYGRSGGGTYRRFIPDGTKG